MALLLTAIDLTARSPGGMGDGDSAAMESREESPLASSASPAGGPVMIEVSDDEGSDGASRCPDDDGERGSDADADDAASSYSRLRRSGIEQTEPPPPCQHTHRARKGVPPSSSPPLMRRDDTIVSAAESRDDDDDIDDSGDGDGDELSAPAAAQNVLSVSQFSAFASSGGDIDDTGGDDLIAPAPAQNVLSVSQFSAFASGGEYVFDDLDDDSDIAVGDDDDDDSAVAIGGADNDDDGGERSVGSANGGSMSLQAVSAEAASPRLDADENRGASEEDGAAFPTRRRHPPRRQRVRRSADTLSGPGAEQIDLSEVLPADESEDGPDVAENKQRADELDLSEVLEEDEDAEHDNDDTNDAAFLRALVDSAEQKHQFADELDLSAVLEQDKEDENADSRDSSFRALVAPCAPSPLLNRTNLLVKKPLTDETRTKTFVHEPSTGALQPRPKPSRLRHRSATLPAAPRTNDGGVAAFAAAVAHADREEHESRSATTPPPPPVTTPCMSNAAFAAAVAHAANDREEPSSDDPAETFADEPASGGVEGDEANGAFQQQRRRPIPRPRPSRLYNRSATLPCSGGISAEVVAQAVEALSSSRGPPAATADPAEAARRSFSSAMPEPYHRRRLLRVRSVPCHQRSSTLPTMPQTAEGGEGEGGAVVVAPSRPRLIATRSMTTGGAPSLGRAKLSRTESTASRRSLRSSVRGGTGRPLGPLSHHRHSSMPASMIADLGASLVISPPAPPRGARDDSFLENEASFRSSGGRRPSVASSRMSLSASQLQRQPHRRTKTLPASIAAELSSILAVSDGATPAVSNGSMLDGPTKSASGRNIVHRNSDVVDAGSTTTGGRRPSSLLVRQRSHATAVSQSSSFSRRSSSLTQSRHQQQQQPPPRASHRRHNSLQPQMLQQPRHLQQPPRQGQQKPPIMRRMAPHAPFREILEGAGMGGDSVHHEMASAQRRQLIARAEENTQGLRGKLLNKRERNRHRRIQSLPSYSDISPSSSTHSSAAGASRAAPMPPWSEGRPPMHSSSLRATASDDNSDDAYSDRGGIPNVFSDDGVRYGGDAPSPHQERRRPVPSPYPKLLADRPRRRTSSLSNASSYLVPAAGGDEKSSRGEQSHRRIFSADDAASLASGSLASGKETAATTVDSEGGEIAVVAAGDDEATPAEEAVEDTCCRDHYEKESRRKAQQALRDLGRSVGRAVVPGAVRAQFRNRGVELKRSKGRLV